MQLYLLFTIVSRSAHALFQLILGLALVWIIRLVVTLGVRCYPILLLRLLAGLVSIEKLRLFLALAHLSIPALVSRWVVLVLALRLVTILVVILVLQLVCWLVLRLVLRLSIVLVPRLTHTLALQL